MFENEIRKLKSWDRVLREIIDRVGPCTLRPMKNYFMALAEAIVSQQLSVKASATIFQRFQQLYANPHQRRPRPEEILATSEEALRGVGLSRQKISYLRDLAQKFAAGMVNPRKFRGMPDEEIIEALVQIKGIGRWTAEMFLIFSLNRLDVLPVDDLGFRKAIQRAYRLRKLPTAEKIRKLAKPWEPYRSLATWYLWASLKNVPLK